MAQELAASAGFHRLQHLPDGRVKPWSSFEPRSLLVWNSRPDSYEGPLKGRGCSSRHCAPC
ncbi:uncharacterized protein THITE_2122037 [Thermothielavioides terrestris NRRL 8126]|uniref:Uncharacterized protein n=1 Tax=Thermothielavioides terrestris (strain ATCC 38088 / NRRL 8126) TaxID=578455 RepID=G2RFM0_THETT|nr:uncharacterized protein THITE_2122037 [Thermothielavioides terrestris NRRL 8126]AEO70503.1 hypothetical protein THITE_2122037 [Thermothielavioides terrestris NRRL 8126]